MFTGLLAWEYHDFHLKSSKVCNKTRSPLASLLFKGQGTEHTTVKWPIEAEGFSFNSSTNSLLGWKKSIWNVIGILQVTNATAFLPRNARNVNISEYSEMSAKSRMDAALITKCRVNLGASKAFLLLFPLPERVPPRDLEHHPQLRENQFKVTLANKIKQKCHYLESFSKVICLYSPTSYK